MRKSRIEYKWSDLAQRADVTADMVNRQQRANMRHRLDGQSPTNCFTLRLCRCCSLLQMPLIIRRQPGRSVAFGIMSMPVLGEMAKMKALAYAGKSPAER
jgi:hypothetical protein